MLQCHGRDITIKTSKTKRNILLILPVHYKFHGKSTYDVQIGALAKTSTRHPEYIIRTSQHKLVFVGKYVAIKSKLFLLDCQMTKKQQNLLAEFYDKALVFTAENMTKELLLQPLIDKTTAATAAENDRCADDDVLDLTGVDIVTTSGGDDDVSGFQASQLSQSGALRTSASTVTTSTACTEIIPDSEYITHLGCSRLAELDCYGSGRGHTGMSRTISGRTGSIQSAPSMSQLDTSVDMSISESPSAPVARRSTITSSRSSRAAAKKPVSYVDNSEDDEDEEEEEDEEEFAHSYRDEFECNFDSSPINAKSKAGVGATCRSAGKTKTPTGSPKAAATGSSKKRKAAATETEGDDDVEIVAKKITPAKTAAKATPAKAASPSKATIKSTPKSATKSVAKTVKRSVILADSDDDDEPTDVGSGDDENDDEDWDRSQNSKRKKASVPVPTAPPVSVSKRPVRNASKNIQIIDLNTSEDENDDNGDADDDDEFEFR